MGARQIGILMLLLCLGSTSAWADETPAESPALREVRGALGRVASSDAADRCGALRDLERIVAEHPTLGPRCLVRLRTCLRRGGVEERQLVMRVLAHVPGEAAATTWIERLDPDLEADERVWGTMIDVARVRRGERESERSLVRLVRTGQLAPGRRALLYEALGHFAGPAVLLALTRPPQAAKEPWVAAAGRARGLGHRTDDASIAPLIGLLEHGERGVVMCAWESLVKRTGKGIGPIAKLWKAWWAKRGKSPVKPAKAEGKPGDRYAPAKHIHVPTYYDVPIPRPGSRVVFCLDISQSMYGDGIKDARRHLTQTLHELPATHAFEIVAFNERIYPYAGRLVAAHPVRKWQAIQWLNARETTSLTNIYDAVEAAFQHMGLGRKPSEDPAKLDMVFLLSDGAPNRGRYQAEDRVVKHIAALSKREVPVHTIAAGDRVFDLLQRIARATGGVFIDAFE